MVPTAAGAVACNPNVFASIKLVLGDEDDSAFVADGVIPTTMDGGSDDDNLVSNNGSDTLLGGSGTDTLNDLGDTTGGDDAIDGGTDDDSILDGFGDDAVSGGAGTDSAVRSSGDDTVRLDDVANDGRAGETKNLRSDLEIVNGGFGNDTLLGNAGANQLRGGPGNDTVDAGPGDDVVQGDTGSDDLAGGAGRDRVNYPEVFGQRVSLDGVRDDGAPGELDNVRADVEDVTAGPGDDTVAGNDAANAAIRPGVVDVAENGIDEDCAGGVAVNLDRDADGFLRPTDCDDANPAISPGARDIPGNGVDEDCSDGPAPFPLLDSLPTGSFDFPGRLTTMLAISIRHPVKGSTLRISCRGAGCPFRARSRRITRTRANQTIPRPLGKAKLRIGTRVELRLTKPGTVGSVVRLRMLRGLFPAKKVLCLPPEAKRPGRCPV